MRPQLTGSWNSDGGILLTTIVVTGVIGMALAAYLTLVSNENQLVVRSQVWNDALPVAEAGIEEALTHCHNNNITNMVSNGWSLSGNQYVKTAVVTDAGLSGPGLRLGYLLQNDGYYNVSISATLPYTITSRGCFAMAGNGTFVCRTIQVTTSNLGVYFAGIVVKDDFDMNGNDVLVDSYDSTDPGKSTLGRYDPLKASDKGDVACMSGLTNSLKVGNANVWGHAYTSANGGVYTGPNGAVGSTNWQLAGNSGVQPGWWRNDLNMSLPDVLAPFTSATPPASGTVGALTYSYVLGNGNYILSTLGKNTVVTGNAVLYVTSGIKFSGSDTITILPGASLQLYNGGADAGFNTIINTNSSPTSFMYYGLNSNNGTVTLNGQGAAITACIYAPYAKIMVTGGGIIYGSLAGRSAKMNGNSAIHYDESLRNLGLSRGFIITSWTEL